MALIELKKDPTGRELLVFRTILFPAFLGIAGVIVHRLFGAWTTPILLWTAGLLFAVLGHFLPCTVRTVHTIWMRATWPMAWLVSHAVIFLVFYGVVVPIGLVLRLFDRTPVRRRFDPVLRTYWTPLETLSETDRYFRQY